MSVEDMISVTEAAAILDVTRQWIHKLIDQGRLDATRIGNQYVITRRSVEEYDQERKGSKKA